MLTGKLIGLTGSLIGLAIPLATLTVSSPLLGWTAPGGVGEPAGLFWTEPLTPHHRGDYRDEALSFTEPPCPGETGFRRLESSALPQGGGLMPYDDLVACVLAAANGRVLRVRLIDAEGSKVGDPKLAAHILSQWRFEAGGPGAEQPSWQRIRLAGLLADGSPMAALKS
jgi:hypothetical protein